MERVIKFRGFDVEKQCWRYGNLLEGVHEGVVHKLIQDGPGSAYIVDPRSVGQFTGFLDKNGRTIYEGDRIRILYTDWPSKSPNDTRTLDQYLIDLSHEGVVIFDGDRWAIQFNPEYESGSIYAGKYGFIEVIGNTYENAIRIPAGTIREGDVITFGAPTNSEGDE